MIENQKGFVPIIIVLIIVAIITGGIFAWQYFRVLEEVKVPEEVKMPEEIEKEEITEKEKITIEELIKRGKKISVRDTYRIGDARMIRLGLNFYYEDHGRYPATLDELAGPPYFTKGEVPKDPTGTSYEYRFLSEINDYQLCINYDKVGRQCYSSQDFEE